MARRLAGMDLPANLLWVNRREGHGVSQASEVTTGGRYVVWSKGLAGGRKITIGGPGWWSADQVAAVETMALVAGAVGDFEWDGSVYPVQFDWSEGGYRFEELWPGEGQFTGTVHLVTMP